MRHRHLPFSPSVRAFFFFSSRIGFSIPTFQLWMLVDFHRILLTHALAFSFRSSITRQENVPTSTSMHSVTLEPTTSAFTRNEVHLYTNTRQHKQYIVSHRFCLFVSLFLDHRSYSPAKPVRGFTLSPQRPSGQAVVTGVFPFSPPVHAIIYFFCAHTYLSFSRRSHFSIFYARRFSSNLPNSRARAFFPLASFHGRKNLYEPE